MRWWWSWELERYDSGVPRETQADRAMRVLQPFLALGFAVVAALVVRPIGLQGAGLARLIPLVLCTVLLLTVPISDRVIDLRHRAWIALAAAVPAGTLMGLDGQGWGGTFAYMVGAHAAIRFPFRLAVAVIGLEVGIAVAVQGAWGDGELTPWWTNLMVFLVLIPGMQRRTRELTLRAAHDVVVQTRRASESEAESRALAERAAIAREIHDVLAHSLSGVNMQLSLAEALFEADQPGQSERGRDAVRTAQRMVVTGLDEARAAVQTLRGDTIDPVEALGLLATGPAEEFTVAGTPYALPNRTVHTLVRVAQEATTNARRHAAGAPLELRLEYAARCVVLTAANGPRAEGSGAEVRSGSGMGLVGMRERAAAAGGALDAGPIPADGSAMAGGWLVRLELPRDAADERGEGR